MSDDHFELQLDEGNNIIRPRVKKPYKKPSSLSSFKYINGVGAVGFEIVLPLVFGFLGGVKLDAYFHTKPILMFVCVGLGLLLSCASLLRIVKDASKSA